MIRLRTTYQMTRMAGMLLFRDPFFFAAILYYSRNLSGARIIFLAALEEAAYNSGFIIA